MNLPAEEIDPLDRMLKSVEKYEKSKDTPNEDGIDLMSLTVEQFVEFYK